MHEVCVRLSFPLSHTLPLLPAPHILAMDSSSETIRGLNLLSFGQLRSTLRMVLIALNSHDDTQLADGGGIRGLSSLLILREIMERISIEEQLQRAPLPSEYFDVIGGTSTGGCVISTFSEALILNI